ncbi:MAG: oxidoreductase [Polyangiales bacterium]
MSLSAQMTPVAVRIAEQYDDGEDARHYLLEPLEAGTLVAPSPGQFFMLSVPGHGEAPFTYVNGLDHSGRIALLARKVGSLTTALFALKEGAVLGVRGPYGRGWPIEELGSGRVLIVAGGCGLAPLCSAALVLASRPAGKAALIYGSRTEVSQVLSAERTAMTGKLASFQTFDHPSRSGHLQGTPVIALPAAVTALGKIDAALICGPEPMMRGTAEALHARGLSHERIFVSLERRMHCAVGLCGHCYVASTYACKQGPTYRYDELLALQRKSPPRLASVTEIHHC